jgi:class 3 adenylate cyclase/tetratricopeptide (TPR) repeat protein
MHCTRCGADVEAQFRFCPQCGLRMGDARDGAPLAGERKLVTVLFCDLTGSTAIAERLDPEDYSDLLERYVHRAFAEVYRFDGYVNQLAGDGFMALFGAPVAHEDAPERAVRAALAVQRELADLSSRDRPVRARIGIHTGPVVVGTVGTTRLMDYTAVGDTTNLAARLEQAAQPGTILMSEATERLVRGRFQVQATPPLVVKGKTESLVAFAVLGVAGDSGAIERAAARGLTPFVGRARELAALQQCFAESCCAQRRVVVVTGDAGSGKSRLLFEFLRPLDPAHVTVFEGRCASLGQTTPLSCFVTMFRRLYGIQPDDDLDAAIARVSAHASVPDPVDLRMRRLLVGYLVDPTAAPPPDVSVDDLKRAIFDVVEHSFRTQAATQPVIVVVEDLHWIDDVSRELLEYLVDRLCDERILFVATRRPTDEPAWQPGFQVLPILLQRLGDDDVRAVLRGAAGTALPLDLEPRLIRRAAGSPFFAEELVRGLMESGALQISSNGVAVLARPLDDIPIPDTVQEVIAARLDRLPPPVKRVAQVAAVIGRQFSLRQLAQVLDGEDIGIEAAVTELERRGLVHRKGAVEADTMRFGESLTQEIAYESLLLKQRRLLHERIATTIESNPSDARQGALLAYHFARSDNRAKAIDISLAAAFAAERVPSYDGAARLFQQARTLAEEELVVQPTPAVEQALATALGALCRYLAMFGLGNIREGEALARRAHELNERIGNLSELPLIRYFEAVIVMMQGREHFGRGLAQAEEAFSQAQRSANIQPALGVARGLCFSYIADGRLDQATRTVDWLQQEAARTAVPGQESDFHIAVLWLQSVVRYAADDLDAALRMAQSTYELAVRRHNRTVQGVTASTLAQIYLLKGQAPEAQYWGDHGLAMAERIGNVAALIASSSVALVARQMQGTVVDPARYLDQLERGLTAAGPSQINFRFVAAAFANSGEDPARGERVIRHLYQMSGGRLRESISALALATVRRRADGVGSSGVEQLYHEALARADAIGVRSLSAEAMLGLVDVHRFRGEATAADGYAARAATIITTLGLGYFDRPHLARARATAPAQPSA